MPVPLRNSFEQEFCFLVDFFFLQHSVGEQLREDGDMAVLDSICKLLKLAFTAHKLPPPAPSLWTGHTISSYRRET